MDENLKTEDDVRAHVERIVRNIFGAEYRGYHILGIGWSASSYKFSVHAYMENSPLHPHDIIYVEGGNDVNDWREYRNSCWPDNAARSLQKHIDAAHDSPSAFLPDGVGLVSANIKGLV